MPAGRRLDGGCRALPSSRTVSSVESMKSPLRAIYGAMLHFSVSVGLCVKAGAKQVEVKYMCLWGVGSWFSHPRIKGAVGAIPLFSSSSAP